jgi:hypothetical protein
MGTELPVYGLSENPFEPRVLDPLNTPRDAELLVYVDGFQVLQGLEVPLSEHPRTEGRPIFFFVVGERGTGRTSAANFLVYRWAQQAGIESNQLVVHPSTAGADPADKILYNWVLFLRNKILERNLELQDSTQDRLTELERARPDALIPALQWALHMMDKDLEKLHSAFAGIIEQLKVVDLVTMAVDTFGQSGTIVVLTAERSQTLLEEFDSVIDRRIVRVVELTPLSGPEVSTVVEKRWREYSNDPNPFDPSGMATAFSDKRRPIALVLRIVSTMLRLKQIDFASLDPWPASRQLRFDGNEIREKLRIIEDGLRL